MVNTPTEGGPGRGDPVPEPEGVPAARRGRVIEVLLAVGSLAVFAVTWLYVAAAVLSDGTFLADTWAWLSSLEAIAAFVVWLLLLPLVVFLWAWQADLAPWVMGLVMLGLVAWTLVALSGLRPRRARVGTGSR